LALADRVAGRAEAAHGQHPLESLFIDEGFGTLDAGETLENVAEALRQLQTTHRMIGVVTHLPQLAEQLPAQVRVIKEAGRSRLRGDRGCGGPRRAAARTQKISAPARLAPPPGGPPPRAGAPRPSGTPHRHSRFTPAIQVVGMASVLRFPPLTPGCIRTDRPN